MSPEDDPSAAYFRETALWLASLSNRDRYPPSVVKDVKRAMMAVVHHDRHLQQRQYMLGGRGPFDWMFDRMHLDDRR
jgi:hypothetical protein